MNYKLFLLAFCTLILASCNTGSKKTQVDLIITDGHIYTVADTLPAQAMAIIDGRITAVGTDSLILAGYQADKTIDLEGKTVLPGLIDAHCHFYGLGQQQNRVDLKETKSWEEVLEQVQSFQKKQNVSYIIGRGWDQNDWQVKEFPTRRELDSLFPNTPVALTRIDGHAMIVNRAALEKAGITTNTPVEGGEIEIKDGQLTGILVDNPMAMVEATFPKESPETIASALHAAEEITLSYGLTSLHDAGLPRQVIEVIDSLQQAGQLKSRIYAMVSNTPKNLDYYLQKGIIKTDRLNVRSVKFYGDGALGSRGAALKQPYSDKHDHYGALLSSPEKFKKTAARIAASDYQMNTHAIGDSTNYLVLRTYDSLLAGKENRRWRVEHAQIMDLPDIKYFNKSNILPSVQPTHATSDMYWAEDRIGEKRIKGAYAYQSLMQRSGMVALGTDFPVEQVSPFLTFYAAVTRQDLSGFPEEGFQKSESLSRKQALQGMTIWAAYASFEEHEKGSLEKGKWADFVVLDRDIMKVDIDSVPDTQVLQTWIAGEEVYRRQ